MPVIDLTGQRFGMLAVLSRESNSSSGLARWLCLCDCGGQTITSGGNLRRRNGQSCGCLKIEALTKRSRTHGASDTREFATWLSMIDRCHNPKSRGYHKYGARGISVCERWRTSFENFRADVGPKPTPKHSIERKDNDGNYEPGNCRWATSREQANNKRTTRFVQFCGRRLPLMEAVRLARPTVNPRTVWARVQQGWPAERAMGATEQEAIADLLEQLEDE